MKPVQNFQQKGGSTGNIKLRRLKDEEYEFEEDANSQEVFYGAVKVKGSEVELKW